MRSLIQAMQFFYGLRTAPVGPADAPEAGDAGSTGGDWIVWAMPLGLAVGLLLAMLAALMWTPLTRPGTSDLWLVIAPAMLVYWLGPGLSRYLGWGRTWASIRLGGRLNDLDRDRYPGIESIGLMALAIVAAAIAQYVAVALLPTRLPYLASSLFGFLGEPWGPRVGVMGRFVFPWTHYGAIVLMAVWGNSCVLLAGCLGRPAGHADPAVRELLALPTHGKLAWAIPGPIALTALFLIGWLRSYRDLWALTLAQAVTESLMIAVVLFGGTMLFAWLLARRVQGHCRATLLSAGLIGEIAFLFLLHAVLKTGSLL